MFRSKNSAPRVLKKTTDGDESRRKRGEFNVELRKSAREDQLQKRRMPAPSQVSDPRDTSGTPTISSIPALLQDVASTDPARQLHGTKQFRKLLSIQDNPPIQQVIESGVLPRLLQFLRHQNVQVQFEAAWALTNVASGNREQTKCVIDLGAIPVFVQLLLSPNKDVREQAVWALGNIAGDSAPFRDLVLQAGGLIPLIRVCAAEGGVGPTISLLRNATWAISNLCRGKPQPDFNLVRHAIPCLNYLLSSTDEEILTDSCWAISYLTDDNTPNNIKIQTIIDTGSVPKVIKLLGHHLPKVQTPALRAIGNIVTGSDKQTEVVLKHGALPLILPLLVSPKRGIRKEACWAISNITAGSEEQIEAVIQANIIPSLINVLRGDEFNVQKEATWAISNVTSNGKKKHMRYIVQQGVIPPLVEMFKCSDPKIIMVALEGLEHILRVGESDMTKENSGGNKYVEIIEECGGVDQIENLQRHDNEDIYKKSVSILQTYFDSEEEGEDQSLAPKASSEGFSFGSDSGSSKFDSFNFGQNKEQEMFSF